MAVDNPTLEVIFEKSGWVSGFGNIAEKVYLADKNATDVFPQDVVDAVRYMAENDLVQKGVRMLSSCDAAKSVKLDLEMKSDHLREGRFVPQLQLVVAKQRDTYDGQRHIGVTYYCRLVYYKNPDELVFAQFNVPQDSVKRIK